jgi:hypothetical protein
MYIYYFDLIFYVNIQNFTRKNPTFLIQLLHTTYTLLNSIHLGSKHLDKYDRSTCDWISV